MMGRILLFLAALLGTFPSTSASAETPWDALRAGRYAVLIRHATAPGFGDPPEFRIGDCSTQRNLSEAGREESRQLGARFKREKVRIAKVLSSRWCRCIDTAKLAFGSVTPAAEFDSFFSDPSTESAQTAAARERIANFDGPGNLVIVTHQVNITALTGAFPGQGEAFVVKADPAGKIELKFRIPPPE